MYHSDFFNTKKNNIQTSYTSQSWLFTIALLQYVSRKIETPIKRFDSSAFSRQFSGSRGNEAGRGRWRGRELVQHCAGVALRPIYYLTIYVRDAKMDKICSGGPRTTCLILDSRIRSPGVKKKRY